MPNTFKLAAGEFENAVIYTDYWSEISLTLYCTIFLTRSNGIG